ncbi:TauD/TfdA family dioxygenase [Roseovarius bejariae]|nr:TauD/TfdA family dioxygenase [Roseovarius bejariae]
MQSDFDFFSPRPLTAWTDAMTLEYRDFVSAPLLPDDLIYNLSEREKSDIEDLLSELVSQFDSVESSEAAFACELMAARLPQNLLGLLKLIASGEVPCGYLVVRGFDIDDAAIGPSPQHWDQPWDNRPYLREEFFQLLLSSAVGGVFGWRTQENGRFLRHIVPIESVKDEQLGGSSATTLMWHTEEAFHRGRADFFTLMCYRNREKATTNISCIDDFDLPPETVDILRQPRFIILPDKSHTPVENESEQWKLNADAFKLIQQMIDDSQPVPLIYGRRDMPMMCVDQAFVSALDGDDEADAALNAMHAELDRVSVSLHLEPGEIVLLDNLRVAHGRSIYKPDYGPKHRWMRRVNIANGRRVNFDLRDRENIRVML